MAKSESSVPESFVLAVYCWAAVIGGELLHQILQTVTSFIDPSELLAVAKDSANSTIAEAGDHLLNASVYVSIVMMALLNIAVVIALGVALRFYARLHRYGPTSQRLLTIFSAFLVMRGLLIFGAFPAGTKVPTWLPLLDGSVQILIAVAAVLAIIFANRSSSIEHVNSAHKEA
ncbi:hypothetical protein [Corynebacterium tapiri]|uniref:Uncharacterized protein n=1 Tax=Corynebacterium tapiri TaxID=1448266 RepID=A0A5C4U2Y4_9CORY|nr:hypothetical protein [Corynebacterium tapiri]TNL97298.1 hypothetical protein FHE74_06395 [Corynebacterium tapiri]